MGGKWEVQTWGGRELHFEKKKLFFHLEKEAFFPSLFLGQMKMWDSRGALAAGTRDVFNVMAEWVMCVESFLPTDHDSVWWVQLRKLMSRDVHLNGAPRKVFLICLCVLWLQMCCIPAISVVGCCTSTTIVMPTKCFGTIYMSLSLYQLIYLSPQLHIYCVAWTVLLLAILELAMGTLRHEHFTVPQFLTHLSYWHLDIERM